MFAGLPGIGVGTLFYVLAALWMPVPEIGRLVRGTSSAARWRRIGLQWTYALSIVLSIMVAERVMLWALGASTPGSFSPARLLHGELGTRAPGSVFATPMMASLILLGGILLTVELFRLRQQFLARRAKDSTEDDAPALGRSERAA